MKSTGEWIRHHESYSNLCKAVSGGCRLCTLLKAGLLDEEEEVWHLESDAKQESNFWIVQDQNHPGGGEGILCDSTLLTGFYYARCSPNEVEHSLAFALAPFFQLRAPFGVYPT
jgi:hypothetical protein